jgi:transposase
MGRVLKFAVQESREELSRLLKAETDVRKRERLQFLFWHRSGLVTSRKEAAALLDKSLPTITEWISRYGERGLKGLLEMDYRGGGHLRIVPDEVVQELAERLEDEQGFASYHEIRAWLKEDKGIEVAYSTVHGRVKYGLDASPKVVRPVSEKHDPEAVEAFKAGLSAPLKEIAEPCLARYARVRYWVQDESRLSIKTWLRRRITRRGVKPRMKTKGERAGYSLYGAVEVKTGEHLFRDGDRMNAEGFQGFLKELSETAPGDFHVLQVDNARFHAAKDLELPDNVMLLYQPPYSPEVNPQEQVWEWLKGKLAGQIFATVEDLKRRASAILANAGNRVFQSITHRDFILDALSQAGL